MKKFLGISLIIIFIILILNNSVYAATATVRINGNTEVVHGTVETIKVQFSGDVTIGVLEGYIKHDSNIEGLTVSSSFNNWTTTYNETTGQFNSFNASGTNNGEIIEIKYKLKAGATSGKIEINQVKLTLTDLSQYDYNGDVSITVRGAQQNNKGNNGSNNGNNGNNNGSNNGNSGNSNGNSNTNNGSNTNNNTNNSNNNNANNNSNRNNGTTTSNNTNNGTNNNNNNNSNSNLNNNGANNSQANGNNNSSNYNNSANNGNNNQGTNSIDSNIPKTGSNYDILIATIVLGIVATFFFYAKMHKYNW